jgi:hypothetical protein
MKPATRKTIPFEFVFGHLGAVSPETRPMFGCTAVYGCVNFQFADL